MRVPGIGLILALLLPVAASAATPAPASPSSPGPVIKEPDWKRRPSGADFARVWPDIRRSAVTRIKCSVDAQGLLDGCVVLSETPPGAGAGAAALKLAPLFRLSPKTVDGKPVDGGEVTIPIHFDAGGPSLRYLPHPVWLYAPSAKALDAAFPAGADVAAGRATLDCALLPDGRLDRCRAVEEVPDFKGFGRAALTLADSFRADVDPAVVAQALPLHTIVKVAFDRAPPAYLTRPDWLSRPAATQALSVFPAQAAKAGLKTGRAVVDCGVGEGGGLTACRVTSEDPPGQGFGAAAIGLTAYMKLAAWTEDGRPTAGARLQLPIRLNAETQAPPPSEAGGPLGATAQCRDGTMWTRLVGEGACADHGGVLLTYH